MAPNQFFLVLASALLLGLSTIAVNQATIALERTPAVQVLDRTEVPPALPEPVRL